MNTYTKEEIRKALIDRLEKEVQNKTQRGLISSKFDIGYLEGYHEAINNILWDLLKEVSIVEKWQNHTEYLVKIGKIQFKNISTDNIDN